MGLYLKLTLGLSAFKLLFILAYRSTDFEVHRNWLAVTYSLPPWQWYDDDASPSPWTLDYPPFFAWFEWLLSQLAVLVDPKIVETDNVGYDSPATVAFQRCSVVVGDLVLAYGTYRTSRALNKKASTTLGMLVLADVGLLMVDHIHFQYNGMLLGLLMLAIAAVMEQRPYSAAFWFSTLLCMKHLYLCLVPAFFLHLLRACCFPSKEEYTKKNGGVQWRNFSIRVFLQIGAVVGCVFGLAFAPYLHQLPKVLARLFPFQRGLTHAYWAPNFWALYNVADKALHITKRLYGSSGPAAIASMTGGLVGECPHAVLPLITPRITLVITLIAILPVLWKQWRLPAHPAHFLRSAVLCAFSAFAFGWHVHEKAILTVIVPLSILAVTDRRETVVFAVVSSLGHFALHPLLFTGFEVVTKSFLLVLGTVMTYALLPNLPHSTLLLLIPQPLLLIYHTGWNNVGKLPFLPLLLTSTYAAAGLAGAYVALYHSFLTIPTKTSSSVKLKRK